MPGPVVDRMSMDERMTICNMSIEGAARVGYVNPDDTTFAYLEGRPFAPAGDAFDRATAGMARAAIRCRCHLRRSCGAGGRIDRTDGHVGDQSRASPSRVNGALPDPAAVAEGERAGIEEALQFMGFSAGQKIAGTPINVAFIGSCTNSRLSDLREAARIVRGHHVAAGVRALVVPGSETVRQDAEREGLHEIFREAGFEWRGAGCSMCLAMNPDRLEGREICASSSNRNFKGRQGSPTGRTLLMSPAMVAAAALAGEVVDVRRQLVGAGAGAMSGASRIETGLRPRRCRCAATTSTPTGSSRRAIFAPFRSRGSSSTSSRTIAPTPRTRSTRRSIRARACCSSIATSAAAALASMRRKRCSAGASRRSSARGYSEIFFGNSVAIGLPCLTVSHEEIERLMQRVEADPATTIAVGRRRAARLGGRHQRRRDDAAVSARGADHRDVGWDGMLLADFDQVRALADRLPYVTGRW